MNYPINQIFQTIQGEGFYTGKPAIFIRMQGCLLKCSWCDTKYTWEKLLNRKRLVNDIIEKKTLSNTWTTLTSNEIINIIDKKKWTAKHIVITGGEPAKYNLKPLIHDFELLGFICQIETSGFYFVNCSENSWLTISPKLNILKNYDILSENLIRANEIKFPIFNEKDLIKIDVFLKKNKYNKNCIIFLQPISCDEKAIKVCIKNCILRNWRLSLQIHKYLNIP